jgi:hypothetical protein
MGLRATLHPNSVFTMSVPHDRVTDFAPATRHLRTPALINSGRATRDGAIHQTVRHELRDNGQPERHECGQHVARGINPVGLQ